MRSVISNSERQTQNLAKQILAEHQDKLRDKTLVFALSGELGSGKTQFVKGLAKALDIKNNVSSPTYILLREYSFAFSGRKAMFYHYDVWRIGTKEDIRLIDLETLIKPGNVIAIEWADKIKNDLAKIKTNPQVKLINLHFEVISNQKRKIRFQ